jgi:hypothetical protein
MCNCARISNKSGATSLDKCYAQQGARQCKVFSVLAPVQGVVRVRGGSRYENNVLLIFRMARRQNVLQVDKVNCAWHSGFVNAAVGWILSDRHHPSAWLNGRIFDRVLGEIRPLFIPVALSPNGIARCEASLLQWGKARDNLHDAHAIHLQVNQERDADRTM